MVQKAYREWVDVLIFCPTIMMLGVPWAGGSNPLFAAP